MSDFTPTNWPELKLMMKTLKGGVAMKVFNNKKRSDFSQKRGDINPRGKQMVVGVTPEQLQKENPYHNILAPEVIVPATEIVTEPAPDLAGNLAANGGEFHSEPVETPAAPEAPAVEAAPAVETPVVEETPAVETASEAAPTEEMSAQGDKDHAEAPVTVERNNKHQNKNNRR